MKKILNSKGQEMGVNKIIIIVIVVLVLVAVIFFIFRADILQRINNSPGYKYNAEDKEIKIDPDALAATSLCPIKIGEVTFGKQINLIDISFDRNGKLIMPSPGQYKYSWKDFTIEKDIAYIFFPAFEWRRDIKIGSVNEQRQVIIPGLGDCYNYQLLIERVGSTQLLSMPTIDELKLINGAYLRNDNSLCIGPKQLAAYEEDVSKIRTDNGGRSSNVVRLIFVDGIDDYVGVWWDSSKKGVGVYVSPNGNEIGANQYFPGEQVSSQFVQKPFYSKQELLADSQFNKLKGKIYNEDLDRIYKLFDNENPEQLISYIGDLERVENHKRIFVLKDELAQISGPRLSNLFYCTDAVPDVTAGSITSQILAFDVLNKIEYAFSKLVDGTSSQYSISSSSYYSGSLLDGWYLYAYNGADGGNVPERCASQKKILPGKNCLCFCRDAGCNNVEVKAKAKNMMEDSCITTNSAIALFDLNKNSQGAIGMNGKQTINVESKAGVMNLYA